MPIAVTGIGAVTPLGANARDLWSAVLAGESGIRDLESAGPVWDDLPIRVGAPVTADLEEILGRAKANKLDRFQQLAVVAAAEAWADAGAPEIDGDRLATVVATGIGGVQTLLGQDDVLEASGARRVSPRTVPMLMANAASAQLSIEYGARAGTFTPVSACAAGAEALALAARLIEDGDADVVIAGGAEAAVTPLTLAAFGQSRALAKPDGDPAGLSRPFDADRRGFVLGEGAGIVVLERLEHALARGAKPLAILAGYGVTSDAHHITATDPSGRGQVRAMRRAIERAGLEPADVKHVNAHATGTSVGDVSEARAVRETFDGAVPPVTAPKGGLGHLVGAAGAVEAILTILTVRTGLIPPTRNLSSIDPEIGLDVVQGAPREADVPAAITNSFGFGGQNVSLVFARA